MIISSGYRVPNRLPAMREPFRHRELYLWPAMNTAEEKRGQALVFAPEKFLDALGIRPFLKIGRRIS